MSRSAVTDAAKREMFASQSDDVPIILLSITHPDLDEDINVNSSGVDVVSNGVTYLFYPFELILPDDQNTNSPSAKLTIDNVDRSIVLAIRSITSPAVVSFKIVYYSALDDIQAQFSDFKLVNVTYDMLTVSGDLSIEDFTAEPYPSGIMTPALFPGLF